MGMFNSKKKSICDEFKGWRKDQCEAREADSLAKGRVSGKDKIQGKLEAIAKASSGSGRWSKLLKKFLSKEK